MTTTRSREHSRRPSSLATVRRIAAQLRGDPRAVALILVVPPLLLLLLHQVFVDVPTPPGRPGPFATIGPIMLAVIPMFLMFIVTSVTMLRERVSGTLERLLTTPLRRWNLIASYAVVFGLLAVVQSLLSVLLLLGPLDVAIEGPAWGFLLLSLLSAVIGVAFGLLASAFARTEFQAVQFMPVFITPQVFLCGLLVPKDQMPEFLGTITEWLPMTWAVDVVQEMLETPELGSGSWLRLALLAGTALLALATAAVSMPRRTR
ncbi:MAG: ABC transporter permease [Arachnia propionica]|uniref:ABC transporter permease n=1 Tax=Arachnia propionica TaxID=1750 RepID=UPI002705F4D7|nr:ABC transporter permease [Arachnia propionica]